MERDEVWPSVLMATDPPPSANDGDLIDSCGTSATKWAEAFDARFAVVRRGEGWVPDTAALMLGWFASAIENGIREGMERQH